MANEKNLKPWKAGQSGNPAGRPKSRPFNDALKTEIEAAGDDAAILRAVAKALLEKASSGDIAAVNALVDRLDGKPVNCITISTETALSDLEPADAIKAITDYVVNGELSPQQGQQVVSLIEARMKAIEFAEFDQRLTELENRK